AEPHDDNPADGFALAVEFGDAAADVRPEPYLGDVAYANRRASLVRAERDALDVPDRRQVAAAAHHVLASRAFEQAPFDVVVAHLDGVDHLLGADVVCGELVRIEIHLILLDEAADAGHFRNARH